MGGGGETAGGEGGNVFSGIYNSVANNPGAWLKGVGQVGSLFSPALGGAVSGIGSGIDLYNQPKNLQAYADALDARDQVKADKAAVAGMDPEAVAWEGKNPTPKLDPRSLATLGRGQPKSTEDLAGQMGGAFAQGGKAYFDKQAANQAQLQKPMAPMGAVAPPPLQRSGGAASLVANKPQALGGGAAPQAQGKGLAKLAQPVGAGNKQQAAGIGPVSMAQLAQLLVGRGQSA